MSSPFNPISTTPVRSSRFKSVTPGSSTSTRAQCSDDPADFALVKIHTAKCSICDKRNTTDEMRRCKGCTWQICHPCQLEREQKGRSLAHGNLMTATPGGSAVRRQKLHSIESLAENKDSEAESILAKIKEEEGCEDSGAKKASASQEVQEAGDAIEPLSSNERKNPERKAKVYKNLAELVEDLTDVEELEVQNALPPIVGRGSKRKLSFKDTSSATNKPSPAKRARMDRQPRMQASTPLPAEWEMTEQEKADLMSRTYTNLDGVGGIRPSQHPEIMEKMFGGSKEDRAQLQSNWHRKMPTPETRNVKIPVLPSLIARNGVPRKSGDEFMDEVGQKVRKNLTERYAWRSEAPAITPTPPAEPATQESAGGNLRDLADNEARTLHHNLALDEDQQNELLLAMKGAARKFGNDMYNKMAPGFKSRVKPGLAMALGHLTDAEKLAVVALVQTQAAKKLKEFEDEIGSLTVGSQGRVHQEHLEMSRESFERQGC